jgi:hypothetical protein
MAHAFEFCGRSCCRAQALPWFSTVRAKLEDPAYAGFFLKFKPGGAFPNGSYHVPNCDADYDPPLCSAFYHDQEVGSRA